MVRSAGSCGGSQIHCTLSKEGEGNVQCIAFEGLAVKRAARQVVMLRKHGKGKCRIERPLRIPVKIVSMCTACWSREGVTNSGTCSPACHDRTSTAGPVQDTHHHPLSPPYGGGRQCSVYCLRRSGSQKGCQTSCHAEKGWQRELQD